LTYVLVLGEKKREGGGNPNTGIGTYRQKVFKCGNRGGKKKGATVFC